MVVKVEPPPVSAITESWNGTNWTETGDLNTGRKNMRFSMVQVTTNLH